MMFVFKTKKYAFTGLGLTLLSFLLLALSGCDATSDPRQSYQTTGSWQGTIGADQVRGIIAPGGSYHLAVVDAAGAFVPGGGEYVGGVVLFDRENNIGKMSVRLLHPPDNAGVQKQVTFKLSGTRLFSDETPNIELSRTSDANSPAVQGDVEGRWSLSVTDNLPDITAVVIDATGNLSGGDGDACQYSGTLKLLDQSWNIFQLDLTFSDYPGKTCLADTIPYRYLGLAMTLPPVNDRNRLWLAANSWELSGNRTGTYFGNWAATINVAPVAKMTIVGVPDDAQSVQLKKISALVELDSQESSDVNRDKLTYTWSGTDPEGTALNFQGTGSAATFSPAMEGVFTLRLMVNDGLLDSATIERQIQVTWAPDPFVDCGNGTVLDTRSNLLWLQDAGCVALNQGVIWGGSHAEAAARVGILAAGTCELSDNSVAGNWRLPTVNDFSYLVPQRQWSEGNLFVNVGTNPDPLGSPLPNYWTADPDPVNEFNWFFVDVSYVAPAEWFGSYPGTNATAVWPVRALRSGEQCPPVP